MEVGCNGSCNALDDSFGKIRAPNKTGDVNLSVSDMITKVNE